MFLISMILLCIDPRKKHYGMASTPQSHHLGRPFVTRIVNSEENIDIRRAAALVIANASSDTLNLARVLSYRSYVKLG